jgi:hypothetical protein
MHVEEKECDVINKGFRKIAREHGAQNITTKITLGDIDLVLRTKKRYFAMVDELGIHLGYMSNHDKKIWREQLKLHLGNDSISEMKTFQEISIKLEELHVFARTEHNYYFNTDV